MTLVVGTDEAGYGPNLGPLVVAATCWESAADSAGVEAAFAAAMTGIDGLWGDSKRIFRGGGGFAGLERGALAGVAAAGGGVPGGWASLLEAVAAGGGWPAEWAEAAKRLRLPRELSRDDVAAVAEKASAALASGGLRLVAVCCRLVQPREFNALLDTGLNKSDILSLRPASRWCGAIGTAAGAATRRSCRGRSPHRSCR
jgi:hypothetical protein